MISLLRGILNRKRYINLDLKKLPSQGYFYESNFSISIKGANKEEIIFYEENFMEDPLVVIYLIKKIIKNNVLLSSGYNFNDISSIDIIYIFLEIVKITKGSDVLIHSIPFNDKTFNYFNVGDLISFYDTNSKEFVIGGFKFKLPIIGIETSITDFIKDCALDGTISMYGDKSYDFMYFLGDKKSLSNSDIINLLTIFNDDMDNESKSEVSDIVNKFAGFNVYSLKNNDGVILKMGDMKLSDIWKED